MKTWPHAPSKSVTDPGIYIITAGTYQKEPFFDSGQKLEALQGYLFEALERFKWEPIAWAIFPNHYHLIAKTQEERSHLSEFTKFFHARSATWLNKADNKPGRKVWYRCWDTRLTFEKSVMARIAYVHYNPVKHGLVSTPENYPYCSASWFLRNGDQPFVESVLSFKTDRVNVFDDF